VLTDKKIYCKILIKNPEEKVSEDVGVDGWRMLMDLE
jgi:hypothetical protein